MRQMKYSGIEWIGDIPEEWKTLRIQFCLDEIVEKNDPIQTTQILSLMKDRGVMLYDEKGDIGNKAKEDCREYKIAYPNTLIVNSMNILIGSVGISNYFGCVSPVYYVFKETNLSELRFVNYIFNTTAFQKELRRYANGILEIRLRISSNNIFKRKIPLPNKIMQIKIADFLDEKCAKIDRLIAHEQAMIEELKAYKQSVITEAVTKGLDESVLMKDSGVEWIGKIPESWCLLATKRLFLVVSGATPQSDKSEFWDGGIKWITPADYKTEDIYVNGGKRSITEAGLKSCNTTMIPPNNIIFSKRAPIGAVAINNSELCTNQGCLACIAKEDLAVKYFYYVMSVFTEQYELLGTGTTFKEISLKDFKDFLMPYPHIQEQIQIADYLDNECAGIDYLIAIKQQKIEELKEYKKSLIYECVTGKKEVI